MQTSYLPYGINHTMYDEFEVWNDFRLKDNDPIDKGEYFTDNCHECRNKRVDLGFFYEQFAVNIEQGK